MLLHCNRRNVLLFGLFNCWITLWNLRIKLLKWRFLANLCVYFGQSFQGSVLYFLNSQSSFRSRPVDDFLSFFAWNSASWKITWGNNLWEILNIEVTLMMARLILRSLRWLSPCVWLTNGSVSFILIRVGQGQLLSCFSFIDSLLSFLDKSSILIFLLFNLLQNSLILRIVALLLLR